ncbi:reverse transcriptase [Corchorus capsularis]|uniref:Reverse transcriptase n=1 Tax=Corchorus capsularis TaxID=210143 RepID=A0A1R3IGC9_COCAP|nr:reverse transcriptase [Corchorus capsularis]
MPPKHDNSSLADAIASLTESINAQMQELGLSQEKLALKVDHSIVENQTSIQNLQTKISKLKTPGSALLPRSILMGNSSNTDQSIEITNKTQKFPKPPDIFTIKTPKFYLTPFDGTNPHAWLFQAERYFAFYSVDPEQRLPISGFFMSGEALCWYQWMYQNGQLTSYESFSQALLSRFGPSLYLNPNAALFKLKQKGTVTEYQEYEILANQVKGLSDEHLLHCFISGLHPEIQHEVITQSPPSLTYALALAKMIEAKFNVHKTFRRAPSVQPFSSFTKPNITPTYPLRQPTIPALPAPPRLPNLPGPQIKRLTPAEMQARRAKGLCYNCDEKYSLGHKCRTAPFLLMQIDDEEESGEFLALETNLVPPALSTIPLPPPPQNYEAVGPDDFQVSFHALYGQSQHRCLKLIAKIAGQYFNVLIDSGSTHNLVQPRVAKFLNLVVQPSPPLSVSVGNGASLQCSGRVTDLQIDLQQHQFKLDLYILDIHGAEVVLGVQWLSQLGPILMDFSGLTMTFLHEGEMVTLSGSGPPQTLALSLAQFRRLAQTDAIDSAHLLAMAEAAQETSPLHFPQTPPELYELLCSFSHIFEPPKGLPPARPHDHQIHLLPGTPPINVKPYRYPYAQKQDMERLITEIFSHFRRPLRVPELIDELHGASVFSKIDLRAGYHQIRMAETDIGKTAFHTFDGHYEFLVMPFGLSNAPSTFQSAMNELFRPFLRKFILVFFDDILVYSKSMEEHLVHLEKALQTLADQHYFAKFSKCSFAQGSVDYLGHIISGLGVAVDHSKIDAILAWPVPTFIKKLRVFLGLTGYYRKFVRGYASLAAPLTDLLKKDNFIWSAEATKAFESLKHVLVTAPVLAIPDFSQPFVLETDASMTAIGAVLSQHGHPIAYFSRKLNPQMQTASAYAREMFAITESVKKWRQYLLGRPFLIYTDQQSLRNLMNQTIQTPEQQRWLAKLLGYQYTILYKLGVQNKVADALSRSFPEQGELNAISGPTFPFLTQLRDYYANDPHGKQHFNDVKEHPNKFPDLLVQDGLLLRHGRIVIPENHPLQQQLLFEYHCTLTGGHAGVAKTLSRLASNFFWSNMRKTMANFISTCRTCQEVKCLPTKQAGLLQPLPIPTHIWQDIAMDFITHLPFSNGKTTIWVIVDRLSKYAHFLAIPAHTTAPQLAALFSQEIGKLHGLPRSIVSDRDPIFISSFWKELFRLQGTKLNHSSAYHPQSDGQSEVLNRCLETYLRCFAGDNPRSWSKIFHWAEWSYNTALHSAINMTPFEAVYGYAPPTVASYLPGPSKIAQLDDCLVERQTLLARLKVNLARAQNRMKMQADRHRKEKHFEEGEWVWVKLQPYRQQSVVKRTTQKLAKKYFGPFQIIKRVGTVAYELKLPADSRIHPVFHVSLLKAYRGNLDINPTPLPALAIEDQPVLEPEVVLKTREVKYQDQNLPQILVKWKNLPEAEATWEWLDDVQTNYPAFHLEDKVVSDRESTDTSLAPSPNEPSSQDNSEAPMRRGNRARNAPPWHVDFIRQRLS